MNKKLYCGIDPGRSGCVVFVDEDGQIFSYFNTPSIGKDYDKNRMAILLENSNAAWYCLEDVSTMQIGGKSSNFDFGRGKGLWEGMLMSSKKSHMLVKPKQWQKEIWTAEKVMKPGKKRPTIDTKATSLKTAQMFWPEQNWYNVSEKTGAILSTINDGLVDAALIAEYCRRKFR